MAEAGPSKKYCRVKKARTVDDIFIFTPISHLNENVILDNEIVYSLFLGVKSFFDAAKIIIRFWKEKKHKI